MFSWCCKSCVGSNESPSQLDLQRKPNDRKSNRKGTIETETDLTNIQLPDAGIRSLFRKRNKHKVPRSSSYDKEADKDQKLEMAVSQQTASNSSGHKHRRPHKKNRRQGRKLDGHKKHRKTENPERHHSKRKDTHQTEDHPTEKRKTKSVREIENLQEIYNKHIPLPSNPYGVAPYTFVADTSTSQDRKPTYSPVFSMNKEAAHSIEPTRKPSLPICAIPRSAILSRQIPIIKVIQDIEEVSTINITEKIPAYKSTEQDDSKDKKGVKNTILENLHKEIKEIVEKSSKSKSLKKEAKKYENKSESRGPCVSAIKGLQMKSSKSVLTKSDSPDRIKSSKSAYLLRSDLSNRSLKARPDIKSAVSLKSRTSLDSDYSQSALFDIDDNRVDKESTKSVGAFNPHASLIRMKYKSALKRDVQTANKAAVATIIKNYRESTKIDKHFEKGSSLSLGKSMKSDQNFPSSSSSNFNSC